MAKIEMIIEGDPPRIPPSREVVEVRVWDLGGTVEQMFAIGSGANFAADGNIWLEIIYSVEGAQIFYTRTFLHHNPGPGTPEGFNRRLDELAEKGEGRFGFGDMLPETYLTFRAEKKSYQNGDGSETTYTDTRLVISADTGAVFGCDSPGQRSVDIVLTDVSLEDGVRFMRELVAEIDAVQHGQHPDPARFPPGSSEWPLVWQLNRAAYNRLSENYHEGYFDNPLLAEAFSGWLAQLPSGGQVLDAGCGHGDPVIGRLLEGGFRVTGSDFSPEMLRRAEKQFPQARFVRQASTQLDFDAAFDGACSFSSLLYLDPIDLYNSLYRLHRALKPGGLLFLHAFDVDPGARGEPYSTVMRNWMWSWHYGVDEAARRVAEHGYFTVLDARRMLPPAEPEPKPEKPAEPQPAGGIPLPASLLAPPMKPYPYVVVAKRCER